MTAVEVSGTRASPSAGADLRPGDVDLSDPKTFGSAGARERTYTSLNDQGF